MEHMEHNSNTNIHNSKLACPLLRPKTMGKSQVFNVLHKVRKAGAIQILDYMMFHRAQHIIFHEHDGKDMPPVSH